MTVLKNVGYQERNHECLCPSICSTASTTSTSDDDNITSLHYRSSSPSTNNNGEMSEPSVSMCKGSQRRISSTLIRSADDDARIIPPKFVVVGSVSNECDAAPLQDESRKRNGSFEKEAKKRNLYKLITADPSQICEGRDFETLFHSAKAVDEARANKNLKDCRCSSPPGTTINHRIGRRNREDEKKDLLEVLHSHWGGGERAASSHRKEDLKNDRLGRECSIFDVFKPIRSPPMTS